MNTIEVDFEVYKQLTMRRATEDVTYNDVVRELLGLKVQSTQKSKISNSASSEDWISKNTRFPVGTEFRGTYKGKIIAGRVADGALVVNGKPYSSPSAAAMSVTEGAVNGWRFWECRLPGKSSWQLIESLRR
jgi:hypothetical protein